jgi:hypothetical protein
VTPKKSEGLPESAINELAALKDEAARSKYITHRKLKFRAATVRQLIEESRKRLRIDMHEALALAEAAVAGASRTRKKDLLAGSFRAKANALYNTGENQAALDASSEIWKSKLAH